MSVITIDEQNKKRIQKFLKQEIGFYGYEQDIELLEQNGELTEELARKVFTKIMNDAHRTRTMLEPEEDSEFREEIEETFARYDKIPKPEYLEEYGFYDGAYNNMELDDIYSNMQIAFELREVDNKYYGCRNLRSIAETVIKSIDGIDKYKIELQPEAKEELQRTQEELKTLLSAEKTDIQCIQGKIELYNGHATNIWNDYLTDIDDVENSQYRWVIHNLTKGELEGNFRNKYMSTSLMTNNVMGRYGNSAYGLIIKPKHIISASYRDTYTLNTRDDEENLFNIRPPLMLPHEVEDICIQQTIEENGEMLNYETTPIYSELVVDEFEIDGVYYISYGEQELAKDYERAKKVADERGLPLIERDISKYRTEHGLEPMTDNAKRNLCRNILWKCCAGDRELEKTYSKLAKGFIDNNYKDFYKKFMELKNNPEFSKEDILRAFADVTRGDILFGKISQNIAEMYISEEEKQMLQTENEYGLTNINDGEILKKRLEKIISDGINYGANKDDTEGMRRFANIKKIMPQFEMFKEAYLQLRVIGLEEQLYMGLDFEDISYDKILERARSILDENAKNKAEEQEKTTIKDISDEVMKEVEEQPTEETTLKTDEILDNGMRINEFGEIIRENNIGKNVIRDSDIDVDVTQNTTNSKNLEQPQQIQEIQTTNMWKNRFQNWYSTIDRVSQNSKGKFLKMKADIVKAISDKIKERTNVKEKYRRDEQEK